MASRGSSDPSDPSPRAGGGKLWAALFVALIAGAVGWWWLTSKAEQTARQEQRQERRETRDRRLSEHWSRVGEESAALMPPPLDGLRLGLTRAQLRAARPTSRRPVGGTSPGEGLSALEERFENGSRAVYLFSDASERLERIQVMSLMPSTRYISAHLTAMNEQYGRPTGVWDCPNTGGVPTRRFTWRHGRTTVSDVFLVYGERVSVTLYIAPSPVIARSLAQSACRPVSQEQLESFPVAPAAQLRPDVE